MTKIKKNRILLMFISNNLDQKKIILMKVIVFFYKQTFAKHFFHKKHLKQT